MCQNPIGVYITCVIMSSTDDVSNDQPNMTIVVLETIYKNISNDITEMNNIFKKEKEEEVIENNIIEKEKEEVIENNVNENDINIVIPSTSKDILYPYSIMTYESFLFVIKGFFTKIRNAAISGNVSTFNVFNNIVIAVTNHEQRKFEPNFSYFFSNVPSIKGSVNHVINAIIFRNGYYESYIDALHKLFPIFYNLPSFTKNNITDSDIERVAKDYVHVLHGLNITDVEDIIHKNSMNSFNLENIKDVIDIFFNTTNPITSQKNLPLFVNDQFMKCFHYNIVGAWKIINNRNH